MNLLYSALTIGLTIAFLGFLIALLPSVSVYPLPAGMLDSLSTATSYLQGWSFVADFSTVFTIIQYVIIPIELAMLLLGIVMSIKRSVLRQGQ